MKTFKLQAAQGDMYLIKVDSIPTEFEKVKPEGENHILAHSESGHHHVVSSMAASRYIQPGNGFVSYIELLEDEPIFKHLKGGPDAHKPIKALAKKGEYFKIIRQRQQSPKGWVRSED